jgi:hypothetical protein
MENITENTNLQGQESPAEGAENATYSEAQVMEMLQRETDRRVSAALKKQEQKFQRQMAEAEKLRNMDESQRREYEFEARLREFEQKEREFAITQNKLEASKVLANRNLPVEFVDYIVADDAETMMANIETFERAFKAAVNDAVSKRISQKTPSAGGATQSGMTKEQFQKLSISQKTELYRTNPNLYNQLAK